jgi:hypothetical protein
VHDQGHQFLFLVYMSIVDQYAISSRGSYRTFSESFVCVVSGRLPVSVRHCHCQHQRFEVLHQRRQPASHQRCSIPLPVVTCKADEAGVLYRGGNSLTNGAQCSIDAGLMRQLGANAVRIDQSAFNTAVADCLREFEDQNLHVLVSLGQLQPDNLNVSLDLVKLEDVQPDANVVRE